MDFFVLESQGWNFYRLMFVLVNGVTSGYFWDCEKGWDEKLWQTGEKLVFLLTNVQIALKL
jgi:hypothetical protein